MLELIADNLATIMIGIVLLAMAALIVISMIKKKRKGQTVGCGCSGCNSASDHAKHC